MIVLCGGLVVWWSGGGLEIWWCGRVVVWWWSGGSVIPTFNVVFLNIRLSYVMFVVLLRCDVLLCCDVL